MPHNDTQVSEEVTTADPEDMEVAVDVDLDLEALNEGTPEVVHGDDSQALALLNDLADDIDLGLVENVIAPEEDQPLEGPAKFEAAFSDASILRTILDAMKDLNQNVIINSTASELSITTLSSDSTSLIKLVLRSEYFVTYTCDRPLALGINLSSLARLVVSAPKESHLILATDGDSPDKISIRIAENYSLVKYDYELNLMDIDYHELQDIETENYAAVANMDSTSFMRIIRDLAGIGEKIEIRCGSNSIRFVASGDIGKGNVCVSVASTQQVPNESNVVIRIAEGTEDDEAYVRVSGKILNQIIKATPLNSRVILSITKDRPLIINYDLGEGSFIRYFVAPTLDDD